ncbi:MAG: hypothetical protein L3J12_03570, partial [Spirochaetales bacterium]|nr:hypothetical protein [Spirochaetales bacterium]
MINFRKLLTPPLDNKSDTIKIYFLKLMLLLSLLLSILSSSISFGTGWKEGIIESVLVFFLFSLSLLLLYLKKLKISSVLFLTTVLLIILISTYFGGNIRDSSLFMIPIIIIVSGLLLDKRLFLTFTTGSILLVLITSVLSWYQFMGIPPTRDFILTSIMITIFFTVTI